MYGASGLPPDNLDLPLFCQVLPSFAKFCQVLQIFGHIAYCFQKYRILEKVGIPTTVAALEHSMQKLAN